jgi:ribosome biogenesis protein ENP2
MRSKKMFVDFRTRIELIQDLEFPCASTQVKVSKDGKYLVASGVYPPQVKVFDLDELSMKFERHIDGAVVQMQVLSSDFSKLVFLRDDRFVEFHARYGRHHQVRIPKVKFISSLQNF